MADVRTLYQTLLRNIHQDASAVNQRTNDSILRAIAESLRYNRTTKTYFNIKSHIIPIETGVVEYNLPEDFLGLMGEVKWVESLTSPTQISMEDAGIDFVLNIRERDYTGDADDADAISFVPDQEDHWYFAIDNEGKKLYTGKSSGFLKLRYVADLGTIGFSHDGTNWIFTEPNTDTALTSSSTYTNKWFTEGFDVLRCRAEYYLWTREFGNTESTMQRAQIALGQWQDARDAITKETQSKKSNRRVRAWI